ncbi:MAG: hypothetical protein PHV59_02840 [Victivallales bacterium]|nr:hypothetical protein [Victivallales bacterium]
MRKIPVILLFALLFLTLLLVSIRPDAAGAVTPVPKKAISIDVTVEKIRKKCELPVKVQPEPKLQVKTKAQIPLSAVPAAIAKPLKAETTAGALPPVSANYRTHLGFSAYAAEMGKRGARFYIFGGSARQLYEINFASRSLIRVTPQDIVARNFSPRTRVIEDEPALDFFRDRAAKDYHLTAPEVILLVPQVMEDKIASALAAAGVNPAEFDALSGVYRQNSGIFTLNINTGITVSGRKKLNIDVCYAP